AAGALRERGVQDVLPHRRPLVGLVGVGLALGLEIDRGAVVGGADAARQERAVVARIVPGEPALVARILPERYREFDRLDRLLAVERDGLAVGLDLLASPRPQIRVPEARRITECVAERLPDRAALGLQLLAGVAQGIPSVRKFAETDLFEPRLPVGDEPAADRPGDPDPFAVGGRYRL